MTADDAARLVRDLREARAMVAQVRLMLLGRRAQNVSDAGPSNDDALAIALRLDDLEILLVDLAIRVSDLYTPPERLAPLH